jgi:hypothetical protein
VVVHNAPNPQDTRPRLWRQATAALQSAAHAGQRGPAAVAYWNLRATAERLYRQEAQARVGEAIASIGLEAKSLESPQIGVIPSLGGRSQVEVFRDWIIYGQEAHDVDATTRGQVGSLAEPIVVALPSGHPLSRHRRIRREQVAGLPLVYFPRHQSPGYHDRCVAQVYGSAEPNIVPTEPADERMLVAVAEGTGITLVLAARAARFSDVGMG